MELMDVYVGVGGNIGNSLACIRMAIEKMAELPHVSHFRSSKIYRTTPVSSLPQNDYLNAVCFFQMNYPADLLFAHLEEIECSLGKKQKEKNEPRVIDLDLLLVGRQLVNSENLQIPHPRFMERLFVLKPLSDLTETIWVPDAVSALGGQLIHLATYLSHFPNHFQENVVPIEEGE